ncbi:hypothetical protein CVT26_003219 [Gymnopilus dilepis]|uniref:Zn(2)-C6 fungal-type domain-containing protein n=1 Tax=Gymnopilus dilepis TaxID=231916 RepID=A0A409Y5C0_9AGAR|nr:hypothetical protein CVT26_003219 [Gymnopilus dilepis]
MAAEWWWKRNVVVTTKAGLDYGCTADRGCYRDRVTHSRATRLSRRPRKLIFGLHCCCTAHCPNEGVFLYSSLASISSLFQELDFLLAWSTQILLRLLQVFLISDYFKGYRDALCAVSGYYRRSRPQRVVCAFRISQSYFTSIRRSQWRDKVVLSRFLRVQSNHLSVLLAECHFHIHLVALEKFQTLRAYASVCFAVCTLRICLDRLTNLPPQWSPLVHPEGTTYFHRDAGLSVVTDSFMYASDIADKISAWATEVEKRAKEKGFPLAPSVELYLQVDDEDCNYFFIDHVTQTVFWLEEYQTSDLGLPSVVSPSHLKWVLEAQYWAHIENFPMHFGGLPQTSIDNLISIFSHGIADTLTSMRSTFPYDSSEAKRFLDLLTSTRGHNNDEYKSLLVARLWGVILRNRYETQEPTRTSRDASSLLTAFAKPKGTIRTKSRCYARRIRRKRNGEKSLGNTDILKAQVIPVSATAQAVEKSENKLSISMLEGQDITVHDGKFTNVAGDYHEHKNTIIVFQGTNSSKDSEPADLREVGMNRVSETLWNHFCSSQSKAEEEQDDDFIGQEEREDVFNIHADQLHFNSLNDPPRLSPEDECIIYETPIPQSDATWSPDHHTGIPQPDTDLIWVLLPYATNYFSSWECKAHSSPDSSPSAPMTEYDYDPKAFETYMKKAKGIARWVDGMAHRSPPQNISTHAAPIKKPFTVNLGSDLDEEDDLDDSGDRRQPGVEYKHRQQGTATDRGRDQELNEDRHDNRSSSLPRAEETQGPIKSRLRRGTACLECRRRKIKCDGVKPKCGPCTSLSVDSECCERRPEKYVDKKRYMEELMQRIEQQEALLNRIYDSNKALDCPEPHPLLVGVPDVVKKTEQSLSMLQGQDITVHDGKFTNVAGDYHEHKNTIIVLQGESPAKTSEPAGTSLVHKFLRTWFKYVLKPFLAKMSAASERLWKLFSPSKSEPDLPALERIAWRTWCDTLKIRAEEPHFNSLNDPPPVSSEDGNIIYETPTPDNNTTWSPEHHTSIPPPNQDFIWVLLPYVTNYFSSWMAAFFLNAHFTQDDYPYDWHAHSALYSISFNCSRPCRLVHWLSKQPAWGRSREFDNTTRSVRRNGATQSTAGDVNSKPDAKMQSEKGNCKISMLEGQDIAVHNSNLTNVGGDYHEHKNTIIVLQDRYSLPDDSSELGRLSKEQLQLSEIFSRSPSLVEAKVNELQRNKSVPGFDNAIVISDAWSDDHFDELHFNSLNDPLPINPEDELDIIYQTSTTDNETTRSSEDCIANQDFVWVLLPYVTNYFSSWYGWLQSWSYTWIPTFRSWVWPSTPIA